MKNIKFTFNSTGYRRSNIYEVKMQIIEFIKENCPDFFNYIRVNSSPKTIYFERDKNKNFRNANENKLIQFRNGKEYTITIEMVNEFLQKEIERNAEIQNNQLIKQGFKQMVTSLIGDDFKVEVGGSIKVSYGGSDLIIYKDRSGRIEHDFMSRVYDTSIESLRAKMVIVENNQKRLEDVRENLLKNLVGFFN